MRYLVDSSAWARQGRIDVGKRLDDLYEVGELCFAVPQVLELVHTTRSPAEMQGFCR